MLFLTHVLSNAFFASFFCSYAHREDTFIKYHVASTKDKCRNTILKQFVYITFQNMYNQYSLETMQVSYEIECVLFICVHAQPVNRH